MHGAAAAVEPTPGRWWPSRSGPRLVSVRDLEEQLAQVRLGFDVKTKVDPFAATYQRADCGAFTLVDIEAKRCTGYALPPGLDGDPEGVVGIAAVFSGQQRLLSGSGDMVLDEGDVVMFDKAQLVGFETGNAVRQCTLLLTRNQAYAAFSWIDQTLGQVVHSTDAQVGLFVSYLQSLADRTASLSSVGCRAAGQAAVELLRAGFAEALSDSTDAQRERRRSECRAFIESMLPDPNLTPRVVADRFGMSLRSLYELFAGEAESVAGLIRRRRLERCRDDLTSFLAVPVTDIAFRWGFSDSSNFTRSFRSHFGTTPTQFRAEVPRKLNEPLRAVTGVRALHR